MSTSATYLFDPDLAEMVDDAFERAGVDPATLTQRHINSARRGMNFMFSYWWTRGVHQWLVEKQSQAVTKGMQTFTLSEGGLDILTASLRRDGVDTPMVPISREDWQAIPDKDVEGRPDRYFVDRTTGTPTVYIWQAGENATDTIEYWYFRQFQDAGRARNTLDIPYYFQDAFAAGLAARLALKYTPQKYSVLAAEAENSLRFALIEDGSRAPLNISVSYTRR